MLLNFDLKEALDQKTFLLPPYCTKHSSSPAAGKPLSLLEIQLRAAEERKAFSKLTSSPVPSASSAPQKVEPQLGTLGSKPQTSMNDLLYSTPTAEKPSATAHDASGDLDVFASAALFVNPDRMDLCPKKEQDVMSEVCDAVAASVDKLRSPKASGYARFLERQTQQVDHATPRPRGLEGCLSDLVFVRTGGLRLMTDDELKQYIVVYGGKLTGNVSGKTRFLIVGDDPGKTKIAEARERKNVRVISENDFYNLVRRRSDLPEHPTFEGTFEESLVPVTIDEAAQASLAAPASGANAGAGINANTNADAGAGTGTGTGESFQAREGNAAAEGSSAKECPKDSPTALGLGSLDHIMQLARRAQVLAKASDMGSRPAPATALGSETPAAEPLASHAPAAAPLPSGSLVPEIVEPWVAQHAPASLEDVIGNNTLVKQLRCWLENWRAIFISGADVSEVVSQPRYRAISDSLFAMISRKAVLLSGPAGVGKTTTARLVCKECGYSPIELNASDNRSKGALVESLKDVFSSSSILQYASRGSEHAGALQTCLILDECDGMDTGGLPYICNLIDKPSTRVPMIFICNDLQLPKLRTLRTKAQEYTFRHPAKNVIGHYLAGIAVEHGHSIRPEIAELLSERVHGDIRHAIHELQALCARRVGGTRITVQDINTIKGTSGRPGPFEIWARVFNLAYLKKMLETEASRAITMDASAARISGAASQAIELYQAIVSYHMTDAPLVTAGMLQNTLSYTEGSPLYAALVSDFLSRGDVFMGRMVGIGDWATARDQAVMSTLLPSIFISKMAGAGKGGYTRPTFPGKILSLNATIKSCKTLFSGVCASIGAGGLLSASECGCFGAPLTVRLLDSYWGAHGENLAKINKAGSKKEPLDREALSVYGTLKEIYKNVSLEAWTDAADILEYQSATGRKKASLTAFLKTIMGPDVVQEKKLKK